MERPKEIIEALEWIATETSPEMADRIFNYIGRLENAIDSYAHENSYLMLQLALNNNTPES